MSELKPTEGTIQAALFYRWGQGRLFSMPNFTYFCNESDYLSITKNGYVDEYEIKISRSDYHAEKKKERWDLYANRPWYKPGYKWKVAFKSNRLGGMVGPHTELRTLRYPNRFWYVVPDGLITPDDLPSYAGLIHLIEGRELHIVHKAPLLHRNKYHESLLNRMRVSAANRYLYDSMEQKARRLILVRDESPTQPPQEPQE